MATYAAKSNYLSNALLKHLLGQAAFISPAVLYVGLFDVDPGPDGSLGVEVSGGGYARQIVQFGTVSATGETSNTNTINYPEIATNWGSISGYALFDAQTGGNMLFHGETLRPDPDNPGEYIVDPTLLRVGDEYKIRPGGFILREM